MTNNEILRGIGDALGLDAGAMVAVFGAVGRPVGETTIAAFMKTEDEDGYIPCSNPIMGFFLDGLIVHNRGKKEGAPEPAGKPLTQLGNNVILKKLRIALDLKEDDLLEIFNRAGMAMTKHELTGLFRKEGHKHYKECTDQLLRGFLKGVGLGRKG